MSYAYTNGDGASALTTFNGATEPVSSLDDAHNQVVAHLKDPLGGPGTGSRATMGIGAVQGYSDDGYGGSLIKLNLNAETLDPANIANTSTGRIVANVAGYWDAVAQVTFIAVSTTATDITHNLAIAKNGTVIRRCRAIVVDNTRPCTITCAALGISMSVNDYLEVFFVTERGAGSGTWEVRSDVSETNFHAARK